MPMTDFPQALERCMAEAVRIHRSGALNKAELAYRSILQQFPESRDALINLGVVFRQKRAYIDAEQCYVQVLRRSPTDLEALGNYGNLLLSLDRLAEAETCFCRILDVSPQNALAHYNLATVLRTGGKQDTRIHSLYETCCKLEPDGIGEVAAIYLSVLQYLSDDHAQSQYWLRHAAGLESKDPITFKGPRNYFRLLMNLLAISPTEVASMEPRKDEATLHVIGESHAVAAHGARIDLFGRRMHCAAIWIEGCKAWHLGNALNNRYKVAFEQAIASLPSGADILMMVGEIDCRPDEGMLIAAKKHADKALHEIARETAEQYVKYITNSANRYGHQITLSGVPASNLLEGEFSQETGKQRICLLRTFNAYLKQYSSKGKLDFLDLYAMTDRGDGRSNKKWHIDEIHLRPEAIAHAFVYHFIKGQKSQQKRTAHAPSKTEIDRLAALFNENKSEDCLSRARKMVQDYPNHGFGWKVLGAVLSRLGQISDSVTAKQRATELMPQDADTHANLGNTLSQLGRYKEAESAYRQALALRSNDPGVHNFLGACLKEQGRLTEAEESYRQALTQQPNYAEALNNLGVVLKQHSSDEEAETCFRRSLELKPDFHEALLNYAALKIEQGDAEAALGFVLKSLQGSARPDFQSLFVACVKRMRFSQVPDVLRILIATAISEPWGSPAELADVAANVIRLSPHINARIARAAQMWPRDPADRALFGPDVLATLSNDSLLCALLESTQCADKELERFLTLARQLLLDAAMEEATAKVVVHEQLRFYSALAQQCFINEYVFAASPNEMQKAQGLKDSLIDALEGNITVPVLLLLAVAAYFPLHTVPNAQRLLEVQWPDVVAPLLKLQVGEPLDEGLIRASIPQLTLIEDEVSRQVWNLYEENPYPRWIRTPPAERPQDIDVFLRTSFPLSGFKPLGNLEKLDILIAGCGTGQHAIATARRFKAAQVLAIDLSLASLSFAKRKTRELGLDSVEFAQADLLKLESVGRRFDIVESVGVLHHLADPFSGWRRLISLLRPGGLMFLGLYSEIARRDIVRAREYIAQQGYDSTPEDMRRCRQDLMEERGSGEFDSLQNLGDFYSVSTCRDLLFHIQEHRLTLGAIQNFLKGHGFNFLGFEIDTHVLNAYKRRFSNDAAATNLSQWQVFEEENPDTFIGMYQFWVQASATH